MLSLHKVALLLVILGAVHIGLVTMVHVDLINVVFGGLSHVINVVIGLSGLWLALTTYTTLLKKTA